jgi:hypothetical protein
MLEGSEARAGSGVDKGRVAAVASACGERACEGVTSGGGTCSETAPTPADDELRCAAMGEIASAGASLAEVPVLAARRGAAYVTAIRGAGSLEGSAPAGELALPSLRFALLMVPVESREVVSCPRFPLTSNGEVEEAGAPTEEGLEVEDSDSGDRLCWLRTEADSPEGSAEGEGIARSRSASPSVVWIEELACVSGSDAERLLGDPFGGGT